MKVTYLGTTVLLFDDGQDRLLVDAHLTRPPITRMLFGRVRTDTAAADAVLDRFDIDRLSAIFVSHSHFDHVMDLPYIAVRTGADVFGSPSALNVARGGGVPEERLNTFEAGGTYHVGGFTVTVLTSLHSRPGRFNNDLGVPIEAPLSQPARLKEYHEGGSYDFLIENGGRRYLVRPSFNCIDGALDDIRCDVLFMGVAGLSKADADEQARFFRETTENTRPAVVVPVHWDNFFTPLSRPAKGMPRLIEDTGASLRLAADYCVAHGIEFRLMLPLTATTL